jgi:hypothetical protein
LFFPLSQIPSTTRIAYTWRRSPVSRKCLFIFEKTQLLLKTHAGCPYFSPTQWANVVSRFVTHILSQATTFAESPHSSNTESALNGVRSCVVGVVAAQDDTKADVIELSVKLAEEKDGRENTE